MQWSNTYIEGMYSRQNQKTLRVARLVPDESHFIRSAYSLGTCEQ